MYLSELTIKNFRQFGDGKTPFSVEFNRGVTALVGENDAGKTAIMDAIRLVLQTRDADYFKLQPEDFHITPQRVQKTEIEIVCRFSDLAPEDRGAFAEYLSYEGAEVVLYVQWRARRLSDSTVARRWVDISVRAGQSGTGPNLDAGARQLLATAYLRPLRDAEREMSSGRGSRLSQILYSFPDIGVGDAFKEDQPPAQLVDAQSLSLAGMSDLLRHLVNAHPGVTSAQSAINDQYLRKLAMAGEDLSSHISFAEGATEITKLRQILERLELGLLDKPS
ncbi:ATP-dependent nuclease [Atopomonas hussainii]|uniref:ATP-dependent nuclease n=1 Tax=Atopomonas hussainii TaxID=1429083 RepID=UPI0009003AEB|nr:AAA family ATPase [Atopomonas hussainii]